jgi:hypothetical protein
MRVASIGGDQMRSLMLVLLPLASCGVDKRMYGTRTLRQLKLPLREPECPPILTETGAYLDHWLLVKSLAWNG